jgi:FtsP/CotA-like multicopper oxidase with cupredoxin domain
MEVRRIGTLAAILLCLGLTTTTRAEKHAVPVKSSIPAAAGEVPEPVSISAVDGILTVTLTAKPAKVDIAGRSFVSNVYNGMYIPPVLRLKRGDELQLKLINETGRSEIEIKKPQMTNLHYHGMAIPPVQPADDVYMLVPPLGMKLGKHDAHAMKGMDIKSTNSFDYRWRVPDDHPYGVYWYHPHAHGKTEDQVLSGMSGLMIIEGFVENHYPKLASAKRRTLALKDLEVPGTDDDTPKTKTVNGVLGGTFSAVPGSLEIWEIGNIGADSYFDLALDGHKLFVLARDGNALAMPEETDHIFLPPSSRAEIAVEIGGAGNYALRTRLVETGKAGDPNPDVVLATLKAEGAPVDNAGLRDQLKNPVAIEKAGPTAADIAALPVTRQRRIVYTENAAGTEFYLDGKQFAMDRIDVEVKLGDVEEWTLVNDTDERHTFHIHQTEFLVLSSGGSELETIGVRDNIDLPYRDPKTKKPSEVTVKIPFTNPAIVGKFPYHCHILEHEDGGMMGNLRVSAR